MPDCFFSELLDWYTYSNITSQFSVTPITDRGLPAQTAGSLERLGAERSDEQEQHRFASLSPSCLCGKPVTTTLVLVLPLVTLTVTPR